MKKISIFLLVIVVLGGGLYFSGIDLSFLWLRSAILSADNCDSNLLVSNKTEYDKTVSDLTIINNYISQRACEVNGQINNLGKNNFEISACQRKITLRENKKTFVDGYLACQDSVNAGPKILSGTLTNATLIEQGDNEATHPNESVYELNLRSQGESYVRELVYELSLPLVNNDVGVTITKVELKSSKTGNYACAQTLAPTQPDTTRKIFLITCRAVDGGYQMGVNGDTSQFSTSLKFWVSTISFTGEGTLKFLSGKYSIASVGGTEKPLTRINGITTGTIKYTAALVDPRDLTVELDTLPETSSTNIPVHAKFNKLINRSTISINDFVLSDNVSSSNLVCTNAPDADNNLRTICTIDLEPNDPAVTTNITVDFPAAKVRDYTRWVPKNNIAAVQKTIHYTYGAPTILIGEASCPNGGTFCEGLDNTPQLIVKAAVGDITAGSNIYLYPNNSCSGNPIQTVSATRNIPQLDLYDPQAFQKNETRNYTVKIEDNCSSLGTTTRKQAGYKYTWETIAQVPRMACMNTTTFVNTTFANSSYLPNPASICDAGDLVDPKKCNAWQWNSTFNPDCFPTGHGTLQDPYRICTAEQLQEMDNVAYFNSEYHNHYRLGQTIDLTKAASWFGGDWFKPIGRTTAGGWYGSLDGNGYEIQNLTVSAPDGYVGLFGMTGGGGSWIHNLKLNNTTLQNSGVASGTLIGQGSCLLINGVESVNISITDAKNFAGGLIGYSYGGTGIFYSKTQGSLSTADDSWIQSIGGMIGTNGGHYIELANSETSVNITAKAGYVGGLIGAAGGDWVGKSIIHDNLITWRITARDGASTIGGAFWLTSYISLRNNHAYPAGSNKITAEGNGTIDIMGWFVGQASGSEFIGNETRYSVQGNTRTYIGGFGGRMDNSTVSRNISSGAIGGSGSKWPRIAIVGGFVGGAYYGNFSDNMSTSTIYLNRDVGTYGVGGFVGSAAAGTYKRNYSTGNIEANNMNDYHVGWFAGNMSEYGWSPLVVTDNFSIGFSHSPSGYNGTLADYFGGFVGVIWKKSTDTFENNYFYNSTFGTCTGAISTDKPVCTSVANANVFNNITQGVYTRTGNSWDFVNTWREVAGGLPVLR